MSNESSVNDAGESMDHESSEYIGSSTKPGDPDGRRLAQYRAGLLSEAERIARALEIMLERANHPRDSVAELIEELAREQRSQLQRAHGRIEPRTRFRSRGGQPLLRQLPVNNLYMDESGTAVIPRGSNQEVFALGAIAIGDKEADQYRRSADAIKQQFFGRANFQFHEPYMRKREQARSIDYSFRRDTAMQQEFDKAISHLIESTEFVCFGVAIRKNAFNDIFVKNRLDPYLPLDVYCVALTLLLERYVDALAHTKPESMGRVRAESIGPKEDAYHQLEYARLLLDGSQWVSASAFQAHLEAGMQFSPKGGSDPGELADIYARELYEWTASGCEQAPKFWHLLNTKVYVRGDGRMGKFGVKVFPDSDIRELVEKHRKDCGAKLP